METMELRYYQKSAIKAVVDYLKNRKGNPCVECPTGAGKTPIIASLCGIFANAGARVLCVAHRKELLEQTVDKLKVWTKDIKYSIVSAGLGEQDFTGQVVVAGVQSVYRHVGELLQEGKIDYLIIDEAHLIPSTEENADGMYQTLIKGLKQYNENLRVIGLTATPYRLGSGTVCGDDKILTEICYKVGITELIANKYLSPLISKAPVECDTSDLHIERGEFKTTDVDELFNVPSVISKAVTQIASIAKKRKSVLIFCCSKDHCQKVAETLQLVSKEEAGIVLGDTPKNERETLLRRFKGDIRNTSLFGEPEKQLKFLCNVEVLTTGFDAPNVDCVVLLRPTASPGLYYQMCGRGLRLSDDKENCLVLDYGGNILRFGPIDKIAPPKATKKSDKTPKAKSCPICYEVIPLNTKICPSCGNKLRCDDFECPRCKTLNDNRSNFCTECGLAFREVEHNGEYDSEHNVLSTENPKPIVFKEDILKIQYFIHDSKKSGKRSLRVDYTTPTLVLSEYVCFEHEGFAYQKAVKWWNQRTAIRPIPKTVKQAFEIIQSVKIATPKVIEYLPKKPGAFAPEILNFGLMPEREPDYYPRTDNPFHFKCPICGEQSFLYEKAPIDYYYIKCCRCEQIVIELSHDTCPNEIEFQEELENFKNHGIAFYDPDGGFCDKLQDFYNEAQKVQNDTFDDLPF